MIEAIEYFFFLLLNRIAQHLPFTVAGKVGRWLGSATFYLTPFRKKITLENLSRAFPNTSGHERREIALGAYRNYGIALMEMFWASNKSPESLLPIVRVANPEVFEELFGRGKGLVLLSGHFGSWELIIGPLRLHVGQPMSVIVQHQRNKRIDASVTRSRRRFGNTTIPMGPSVREVLTVLGKGGIVSMLGDQSGPRESVFIDFFGRPAATRRGPAAFCLKTGAPMIMVFLVRQPDGTYVATFKEVDLTGLDSYTEENVVELTRRHVAILEKHIRLHPDHWLWMHKRWKHTPFHQAVEQTEDVVE